MTLRSSKLALSLAIALSLAGCESDRDRAFKELQLRGIEASGLRLLQAVNEADQETLGLLLEAGVYEGQRDDAGKTVLHLAVEAGQARIAGTLIAHGADVNAETDGGTTPLAMSMEAGDLDMARTLIACEAEPVGRTSGGELLVPWAVREQKMDCLRMLMEAGADPHQRDETGNSLLHLAMGLGRRELAAKLIELGADCGAPTVEGESAVVVAIRKGWRDQLGSLVRSGADPNLPDRDGLPPFERAVLSGDEVLARELRDLGATADQRMLDVALAEGYGERDRKRCGLLLRLGARPSPESGICLVRMAADDDETGFLHLFLGYAGVPDGLLYENCLRGREHVVSLLLAHGASPNPSRLPFLDSPFGRSVIDGSDGLSMRLLDAGADPGGLTVHGVSPLHVAIVRGRAETVARLLERGAPVNARLRSPVDGPFLDLVRGKTMRWLLEKDRGVTPLMLAVDSGSLATVQVLLDHGADKNVWTRRASIWPINLAARHEDVRMMRLLLGKDPHVEERRVVVDLSDQELVVFGVTGEEVLRTKISTGKKGYETPTGEFAITNRYRSWQSTIYHASMPYFQRLSCSDFGFHQGYVPSRPASHGCIRVPSGTASRLFKLTELGDRVTIVP